MNYQKKFLIIQDGRLVKETQQAARVFDYVLGNQGIHTVWRKRLLEDLTLPFKDRYYYVHESTWVNGRFK